MWLDSETRKISVAKSSLIKIFPRLKVLRLYKMVMTLRNFANGFRDGSQCNQFKRVSGCFQCYLSSCVIILRSRISKLNFTQTRTISKLKVKIILNFLPAPWYVLIKVCAHVEANLEKSVTVNRKFALSSKTWFPSAPPLYISHFGHNL